MDLLQTFDYTQRVKQPRHKGNYILDQIITRSGDSLVHHTLATDPILSGHYTRCCKVILPKPPLERK